MKVLLVKPSNLSDHIQPSLGLGYLATAVRGQHEVRILDCIKERINVDRLGGIIRRYKPDLLGLQCYTFDLSFIRRALKIAKEINKNIITIVGGPHPSAMPVEMMRDLNETLDFLFVGESEIGFPKLLDSLSHNENDLNSIPGLTWRKAGEI